MPAPGGAATGRHHGPTLEHGVTRGSPSGRCPRAVARDGRRAGGRRGTRGPRSPGLGRPDRRPPGSAGSARMPRGTEDRERAEQRAGRSRSRSARTSTRNASAGSSMAGQHLPVPPELGGPVDLLHGVGEHRGRISGSWPRRVARAARASSAAVDARRQPCSTTSRRSVAGPSSRRGPRGRAARTCPARHRGRDGGGSRGGGIAAPSAARGPEGEVRMAGS